MGSEKSFENKIKNYIESIGGWQVKYFANRMTKKGIPDVLACVGGYFVGLEVKAQNGHPTELQKYQCEQIRKAGGFAFIVYPSGWDDLKVFLTDLNNGYKHNDFPLILK